MFLQLVSDGLTYSHFAETLLLHHYVLHRTQADHAMPSSRPASFPYGLPLLSSGQKHLLLKRSLLTLCPYWVHFIESTDHHLFTVLRMSCNFRLWLHSQPSFLSIMHIKKVLFGVETGDSVLSFYFKVFLIRKRIPSLRIL